MTIIIIGSGFSGTMVAIHLLRLAKRPLTIKLIERQAIVGQGVAYRTALDCHLLNVPAGKMSAFQDDPEHFLRWLQQDNPTIQATAFVPRKYYGQYLRSILEEAQIKAQSGVSLELIRDEVSDIKTASDGTFVYCNSGEVIKGDRIVLALGNFPPANPLVANPSFYQSKRYISWAWSTSGAVNLSEETPVLLMGSGLTAIDLVLALHQQKHKGKIYLVSRRGLLPHSHQPTQPYPPFLNNEASSSVLTLLKQIRQEIKTATTQGYDWRAVIDSLRPQTQALWQGLSIPEKKRFIRHIRPYWDIHRHRVAPEVAQTIAKLLQEQQLIVHAGKIQAYQKDSDGVDVLVCLRHSQQLKILRTGVVINCTGSERLDCQWQNPLLLKLLTSGFVRSDPLQLGLDVDSNGALLNVNRAISSCLYTLGPTQKGCLWETTAVAEIRQQAEKLASILLNIGTDQRYH